MIESPTEKLKLDIHQHTALITIDNPAANTWDKDSLSALKNLVEGLNKDKSIYALVVTGQGEKFFSAGADLTLFADGDKANARSNAQKIAELFGSAFEALSEFRGVSIAAINGFAMGGGLEFALACDFRVAEAQAVMALPEAKVGLLPCGGGTQRLPWLVGESWASKMILLGEQIDAKTALSIGLVGEVVAMGNAKDRAMTLAKQVCQQSPSSVAACKKLLRKARELAMNPALPTERDAFVGLFDTEDQAEGVKAFLEKRQPDWKNA